VRPALCRIRGVKKQNMKKLSLKNIIIEKSARDIKTGSNMELSDGINIIAGDNESGKSSILDFIRHGFSKKGSDSGRIYFNITDDSNTVHYRTDIKNNKPPVIYDENNNASGIEFIEKIIDKKYFEQGFTIDLDDLMNIKNKDAGLLVNTIKDPSGEKAAELLDNIKNEAKKILGDNGRLIKDTAQILEEIKKKNIQINELSDYEARYNSAVLEIEEASSALEKIYNIEKYLDILEKIKHFQSELIILTEKKNINSADFNEKLLNEQEKYAKIIRNSGAIEAADTEEEKIKQKASQLSSKINELLNIINTEYSVKIDREDVKNIKIDCSIIKQLKDSASKKQELETELSALNRSIEDITENLTRLKYDKLPADKTKEQQLQNKKLRSAVILLLVFSSASAVFSFLSSASASGGALSLFSVSGILTLLISAALVYAFFKIPDYKNINEVIAKNEADGAYYYEKLSSAENKVLEIKNNIEKINQDVEALINSAGSSIQIPSAVYAEAAPVIEKIKENADAETGLEKDLEEINSKKQSIIDEFYSFISETGLNISLTGSYEENLRKLRAYNDKNNALKSSIDVLNVQIESLNRRLEQLNIEKSEFKDIPENIIPKEELAVLKQEKQKQKKEAEFKKREIEKFEGLNDLKMQKAALLEEYRNRMSVLVKDKIMLETAAKAKETFENVQPDLKSACIYIQILTGGRYSKINLDLEELESADLKLVKKWNILSRGTKEQLYLALKLGYASNYTRDRITHKENGRPNLPLIIDDAFVNFDETRLKYAVKCLIDFSKTNQVLFFTCRSGVKNSFEKICRETGAELNIITL